MNIRKILQQMACLVLVMLFLVGCATPVAAPPTIPATATLVPPTPSPEATPSSTSEAATLTIEITKQIVYANVDEVGTLLDVYAPSQPGPWPVVVVVHGVQSRMHLTPLSEAIASQGAVVYNIDVMFAIRHQGVGIERIACAVRFAHATASDYGGDPGRITLVGNSLGAAPGAVVALAGDDFEGDCVATEGSALLDALVGYEGPYDYATNESHPVLDYPNLKDEDPDLWEAINPYSHIGRNPDLQVRLVHGNAEDVAIFDVPLEASMEFHQALADAGYDVELIVVEGAAHTALLSRSSDAFALVVQQVMELARSSSP